MKIDLSDITISTLIKWRYAHDQVSLANVHALAPGAFDQMLDEYQNLSKQVATLVYLDVGNDLVLTDEEA